MPRILNGRYTARMDEPFVVFIIGMRINRFFAFRKWIPTMRAMGPMLRELYQHPEKGFLGAEFFLYWRGPALVQYWRSFEDLERFARNQDDPHLPAWRRFNGLVGSDGSVGIWHETYIVEQGKLRGDLLQHACLRSGQSHRARPRRRAAGDRAPSPDAGRKRAPRPLSRLRSV